MSYSPSATTLAFEPRRSPCLSAAVVGAYAVATGVVLATLPLHWSLPLALAGMLLACWEWHRLGAGPRLFWSAGGEWHRGDPEGPAWTLEPSTWSTPWLIVLVLSGPAGRIRIPLARDAVPAAMWRKLRARLRTDGAGETASGTAA